MACNLVRNDSLKCFKQERMSYSRRRI
jgi:hypothetical protein